MKLEFKLEVLFWKKNRENKRMKKNSSSQIFLEFQNVSPFKKAAE